MNAEKQLNAKIRALRSERLGEYRKRGYEFLAAAIQASSDSRAELELLEASTDDGKEYQIEVTAFWDGKPNQDIRVLAEALPVPLKPLFGFIPIYFGGPSDDFIMRSDDTCIGE